MTKGLHISPLSILQHVAEHSLMLILLVISAASLVSCDASQDIPEPEPEPAGLPITFSGNRAAMQTETRAAADGTEDLEKILSTFKVWGYKTANDASTKQTVFPGYYVEYNTTKSNWGYTDNNYANGNNQNTKYWDETASAYQFIATAPFVETTTPTLTTDDGTAATLSTATKAVLTYTLNGNDLKADGTMNTANNANLYYSDKVNINGNDNVKTAANNNVTLKFNQPMAKVRFMFTYPTDIKAINVAMSGLKFAPVTKDADNTTTNYVNTYEKGTNVKADVTITYSLDATNSDLSLKYTAATGTDAYAQISIPYEDNYGDTGKPAHASVADKWYYVIPINKDASNKYLQGAYFLYGVFNAKPKTATVPAEYMYWQAGHEYTYIFKITETSLSFVQVIDVYTKWQAGYSQDVEW